MQEHTPIKLLEVASSLQLVLLELVLLEELISSPIFLANVSHVGDTLLLARNFAPNV